MIAFFCYVENYYYLCICCCGVIKPLDPGRTIWQGLFFEPTCKEIAESFTDGKYPVKETTIFSQSRVKPCVALLFFSGTIPQPKELNPMCAKFDKNNSPFLIQHPVQDFAVRFIHLFKIAVDINLSDPVLGSMTQGLRDNSVRDIKFGCHCSPRMSRPISGKPGHSVFVSELTEERRKMPVKGSVVFV